MGNALSQSFWIPKPTLTESNLPDQTGKVHIITGGYAGIGYEATRILHEKNATVYIAGRNSSKATQAIDAIRTANPDSKGRLEFMQVDLADLTTIRPAVDAFTDKETRLDVLTNNAGVMFPPQTDKTAQGLDLQMGTNCVGPFLLTQLLLPTLQRTASSSTPGTVRVTWAASLAVDVMAASDGVTLSETDDSPIIPSTRQQAYSVSKCGNYYLAAETARRYGKDGIISVAWNPGNLKTELQRHAGLSALLFQWMLFPAIYGAYTILYSGWSGEITESQNGAYIFPWGRIGSLRPGLAAGTKPSGKKASVAERFWEYCERTTKEFR